MRPPRAGYKSLNDRTTPGAKDSRKNSVDSCSKYEWEWTAAVQSMRSNRPQFHAIARQHVIDGDALFETLEVRLWRWHESYNGKRYWPSACTIQPCWQASAMASCAVRLEQSVRSMTCWRSWL